MAEKSRVTTPRGRYESLVPGVSSSRLRPDSDQSRIWCRARPWLVCDSLNELTCTWVSFVVHWPQHLTIFFFFFCRFVTVLFDKTVTEYRVWHKVHGTAEEVRCYPQIPGRYRRTKPPKPDASQSVVPARLPKPAIGSGGLSSSRFDDDVPEVNCTWTASFSRRVKEAALWFELYGSKNLTGGTTCSSQSILTRTHHWSSPRSKLAYMYKKPTSTRKLRKFPVTSGQGSKQLDCVTKGGVVFFWRYTTPPCHDDERDDDRSHRRVSIMSSLDAGWFRLITNILIQSRDLAMIARWHQCGTMTSQMFARASFSAVCLTVFPFEFRPRTFTIGFYGKKSIISELMILEGSFPLNRHFGPTSGVRNSHFSGGRNIKNALRTFESTNWRDWNCVSSIFRWSLLSGGHKDRFDYTSDPTLVVLWKKKLVRKLL